MFKKIILILALLCMIVLPVFGQTGTYTTNGYFYLPEYGEYGTVAFDEYNLYMQKADTQIEANKTMGEASVTTSGTPEVNDIARFTGATVIEGLSYAEFKAALAFSSDDLSDVASIAMLDEVETITGNWVNTAHPWAINEGGTNSGTALGNDKVIISSAGAIIESATITVTELGLLNGLTNTIVTDNNTCTDIEGDYLSITTGVLNVSGLQPVDTALTNISALAYVSPSYIKLTADDTYAVRTLTEVKTDLAYQLSDMSDVGVTTPTDKYVLVADGDSWESRALVEADISDLGAYLTNITGESLFDLSDVTADPNADKFPMWDDDPGELVWIDLPGGGDALTANPLSQFAATTSADLAGVISDETGSGLLVYGTSPTIASPTITGELGGELDAGAHSIGFTLQTATGDGTTTIDWTLGNKFEFTFGAQNDTFTFTPPTNVQNMMLWIIQDGTGSRTITWPNTCRWPGGTEATLSTAANAVDIVGLAWNGTYYDCVANNAFAVP